MIKSNVYATDALAALRMKKGYSQSQFVNILKMYDKKITLPAYAKWETGKRPVSIERVILIAASLSRDPWVLFKAQVQK